jgi:ABC-type branched-subunit amino acid transport system substrate-binding protein
MALGQAMLAAAQIRYFDMEGPPFELIIKDTQGTGERAGQVAQEAIKEKADLILGPVFASEVTGVKEAMASSGTSVPLITFSNNPEVLKEGIYTLGHLPTTYVQRVLDFAHERGWADRDVVVILPQSPYGIAMESAVRKMEMKEISGPLSSHYPVVFYDITQDRYLRQMASQVARLKAKALFIPEGNPMLSKILEALTYGDYDFSQVRILGTYGWLTEEGQKGQASLFSNPSLQRALIAAPDFQDRVYFMKKYQDLHHKTPPHLAILSYDAISIAAEVMGSIHHPSDIIPALTAFPFNTAEGVLRFKTNGENERQLAFLEVGKGGFALVDAAHKNVVSQARVDETAPLVQQG